MNRAPILYFSLFVGLIAFSVAYCTIKQFHLPLPRYYPTQNQWAMINARDVPSIGWYAQTLASLCVGGVSGGLTYLIGRLRGAVSERAVVIVGWSAVAVAFLMMVYVFQYEWRHWFIGNAF